MFTPVRSIGRLCCLVGLLVWLPVKPIGGLEGLESACSAPWDSCTSVVVLVTLDDSDG